VLFEPGDESELRDKTQSEKKAHNSLCSLANFGSLKEEVANHTISEKEKKRPGIGPLLYFEGSSVVRRRR
jgi:hypothetical protein